MSALVTLDGVTKRFGGQVAVDDVSFSVREGTVHALIGPNGAGKTTLINLMTGHLVPTAGTVKLDGQQISGRPPHVIARRGLSRVFQITNVFPRLTVSESVEAAIVARDRTAYRPWRGNRRRHQEEIGELLTVTGLVGLERQQAGTLSHGDKRVLELTLALAARPRMLLLDEPTSGMSPWETERVVTIVRKLRADGLTVLLSEHDMNVVFSLADHVTVLHLGDVLADGAPADVRADADVIAAYLGAAR